MMNITIMINFKLKAYIVSLLLLNAEYCSATEDMSPEAKALMEEMHQIQEELARQKQMKEELARQKQKQNPKNIRGKYYEQFQQIYSSQMQKMQEREEREERRRNLAKQFAQQEIAPNMSPEARALMEEMHQIWKELARLEQEDYGQLARTYSQTIAENLAPYKYCEDVEQAAQLSLAIENFQTTVDKFIAQNFPVISKLNSVNKKLNEFPSNAEISLLGDKYSFLVDVIDEKRNSLSNQVMPLLFEPFLLQSNDPIVKFETLITETDGMQLPMVVYSPTQKKPGEKLPCVIWVHGGNIASDLKDDSTLHIESPGKIALPFHSNRFESNISVGIQPLARFLVSHGIVFVTTEWNAKYGQGNLCQQIKDQIKKVKELDYVDTDKMAFLGHSIGGHILSLLSTNDPQFLEDNFKLGVAFVSPVLNEAWLGGDYDAQPGDLSQNCFPHFALFNDVDLYSILNSRKISTLLHELLPSRPNTMKRILQYVYPFSPTRGMSDDELQPKLASLPQIFILMGTADSNTLPATQGGTLAWRLSNMGLKNWQMLIYKNALHSSHRLGNYFGNPPSTEGFKQMLSDVLQIAHGNPPNGTQDLSELSNGTTAVYDCMKFQRNTMRSYAERSRFMKLGADNRQEFIPFGKTACGQGILEAMRANDESLQ
ncbi:MAG: hypothetical protein LBJ71_04360 [Holosporaceae bacterium]|jgi:acetyl esterase/lipase/Rps23 Pro-64 3,4-dihydroxylase Tpa1-like proline 4-hydroxylase|nr:hypothetical protein [Holosporaceae bacterium]